MITKNNRIKCDFCGRFISHKDIANSKAYNHMSLPESHVSKETFSSACAGCAEWEKKQEETKNLFQQQSPDIIIE